MLAVVLTLLGLVVVLYLSLSTILGGFYGEAEQQTVLANIQRVTTAYRSEVGALQALVIQWAEWDASYAFMQSDSSTFVAQNLNTASIASLGVDVVAYIRPGGGVLYSTGYNPKTGALQPLSAALLAQLTARSPLLQFHALTATHSGLIVLPGHRLLLVEAGQVLTSSAGGPPRGTLVFGRYMNRQMVATFGSLTHLAVSVAPYAAAGGVPGFALARRALGHGSDSYIQPVSNTLIAGYTLVRDIYGRPAVIFRITLPRSIHRLGQASLRLLLLALLVAGAVFILLTIVLLERLVLSRVARLSAGVKHIRSKDDLSQRLVLPGVDELSGLAADINRMLADLADSVHRQRELQQQVAELRIEIDEQKKAREVSRIVDSDYFQDIQRRAAEMRQARTAAIQGGPA